ncbi:MAG: DNA alkylation repair protein [Bacteroidetes bacterium]|nr:DNA alkylation repair protein [Bacteroidota bacterium]MCL5267651.1 DNA alkylation repair protein [Bacteroidota bacterium]
MNSKRDALKVVRVLEEFRNPESLEGLSRYGISTKDTLGISIPILRDLAKEVGRNHALAVELWNTGIHEARILAGYIDDPEEVTSSQMESWAKDFDSWDVCDQICSNLFDRTKFALSKAVEWTKSEEEFVKRAGFVLMAALAVHDKEAGDEIFLSFLPIIRREAADERNFVKKAANWALRQIGKRNLKLNKAALKTAKEIRKMDSKTARWVATDAIRELTGANVLDKLRKSRPDKS